MNQVSRPLEVAKPLSSLRAVDVPKLRGARSGAVGDAIRIVCDRLELVEDGADRQHRAGQRPGFVSVPVHGQVQLPTEVSAEQGHEPVPFYWKDGPHDRVPDFEEIPAALVLPELDEQQ